MTLNRQIALSIVEEMEELWGGSLPDWSDFKEAYSAGRVRANKTVAAQAIHLPEMPRLYFLLYGAIVPTIGFLILPLTIVAWFFAEISGWWIIGALAAAFYLFGAAREGHCQAMMLAASKDEAMYLKLIRCGAFLFGPRSKI